MTSLADSDAFRDDGRVLSQHHAAITLLQPRLSAPGSSPIRWLDLGCGRGQILGGLREAFSDSARQRIDYVAYDIDQGYIRETARHAENLNLRSISTYVGDLASFDSTVPSSMFEFITLTNTAHEIGPFDLVDVIISILGRLSDTGLFYAYDMETLERPELGALPWSREEIRKIFRLTLKALGVDDYEPEVSRIPHRTTTAWGLVVEGVHLGLSAVKISERRASASEDVRREVTTVLWDRLQVCRSVLESLTRNGASTAEENAAKLRYLYEYWALSRILRNSQ